MTEDRVLLDACVVVALATEGIGSVERKTRALLESEHTLRLLSSLSIQEIAQKVNRGRLALAEKLMTATLFDLAATVLPYNESHARRLFRLPLHPKHSDPIDRMLVCTALCENLPIVTSDRSFAHYKGLRSIAV